ncbi:prepilin-type N-terminal cleavage/methylation domain-containing protein [Candidatus Saccharibacteria bacterium]|nr:prepilin-type N-terminal cleavage/methylation domain-containing protein [Candidatus Saccharibacteria bacterium]
MKTKSSSRNRKLIRRPFLRGFSLVELIIVIIIIGILAGLALASFIRSQQAARDSRRQTDIKAVEKAIKAYHAASMASTPPPAASPMC